MIRTEFPQNAKDFISFLKTRGIPEIEYKRRFDLFLENKARLRGIPLHGTFELTPLCNLDCKMCYVHLNTSKFDSEKLIPPEDWMNIIKQAREAGMIKASLTGGECLTYPWFDEVYLFLYKLGIKPGILCCGGTLLC